MKNKYALVFFMISFFVFAHGPMIQKAIGSTTDRKLSSTPTILANPKIKEQKIYQEYVACLERVFDTMSDNYYRPVTREAFNRFLERFNKNIYAKIVKKDEKSNFICWRSAAYLVDALKDQEDTFSAFFPPKAADKFEKKVLGENIDLGIEGKLTKEGYVVMRVEPRSDAYSKGLRESDIIQQIDKKEVLRLTEKAIQDLLTPLINTTVTLDYIDYATKSLQTIAVISQEYFKQSVFPITVDVPGVYGLEIRTFNRKTSEDLFRFLAEIEKRTEKSFLILDLRGNPGGPPLAAREIAAFFLTPNDELAYFQKKGQPKAMLTVPEISEKYRYSGPIAILVNKESGSASELFSGVMQKHGRAVLIGTNTAGKVMLKSMFPYDDGSMLLLVTARGHFPDGSVFDFNGVVPDISVMDDKVDLVHYAASYLKSKAKITQ